MTQFRPGDQVFWWKRITRAVAYPYRAEITAVGPKRITIIVEDTDGANDRFIRHVAAESLQPFAGYYEKAADQGPAVLEPAASWGRFTRYLEIGDDLRPVRQVDVFEDGHMLSYDRVHWVDEFGMLGDAKINRNRKSGPWGRSKEIESAEFERIWGTARTSQMWPQADGDSADGAQRCGSHLAYHQGLASGANQPLHLTGGRDGGKGSHRKLVHPRYRGAVTVSGKVGDDAKPYQEKQVRRAIDEVQE